MDRSTERTAAVRMGGLLVAALLCVLCGPARAQLSLGGGFESFHWTEDTKPRQVDERGPLASLALGWTQPGSRPFRLAYRSRYYLGWVDYRGSYLFADRRAASGTSRYAGTSQEGQLRVRIAPALDVYGAFGGELWRRSLGSHEREDFRVGYTRLGVGTRGRGIGGWLADAGVKFIRSASEDAHLRGLGFDQNPRLSPRGLASAYAQLGYRLHEGWVLHAYADGYRFRQSPPVSVTRAGEPDGTVFQPGSNLTVLGAKLAYQF